MRTERKCHELGKKKGDGLDKWEQEGQAEREEGVQSGSQREASLPL